MKINFKIISLMLILLCLSITVVSATEYDNQTIKLNNNEMDEIVDDVAIEPAISNAKNFTDLQKQFWATQNGGTLVLEDDYVYNEDFKDGRTQGIGVDRSTITVDGNGHTIDGNGKSRILWIYGYDNIVLKNIKFINGYHKDGCGAIYCKGENLTIINCTFENNSGNLVGGAVSIYEGNNPTIENCTFKDNRASQSGGALRVEVDNAKIIGNKFINNTAVEKLGGAISSLSNNTLISKNYFIGNFAGRDGGAMSLQESVKNPQNNKITIINNIFRENTGEYGGAFSLGGLECTISNNEFVKNHAIYLGGAIRLVGSTTFTGIVNNNTFEDNFADISGGSIYAHGNATNISNNIFKNSSTTTVAGGTLNINGDQTVISNNEIINSHAKTIGGAFYLDGANIQVINNKIDNATSENNGGAIYITGESTIIKNNTITNCKSDALGGALFIKSNKATLNENEFTGNIAKSSGGAIYLEGSSVKMTLNNFTANQAGESSVAGAVRWTGNNAEITNNNFIRNTAKVANAIYGSGDNPTVSGNYYSNGEDSDFRWESNTIKTTLTVPSKSYSIISTSKTLTATLKDANGKAIAGKEIEFVVNGNTVKSTTNTNGVATAKFSLSKVNSFPATINFMGDNTYEKSTQTAKITVTKDKTKATAPNKSYKKSAKSKKLTFTLKTSTNKVLKNKKITFKVKGKTYTAKTNSKGVATITVKLTKKGTYKFTAKFAGDSSYAAVSKTAKLVLK